MFRYQMSISPDDVGARVSVRHRLSDNRMTDAVGELLRWSDGALAVRRRDGTVTEIAEEALVAGKRVPPPPARVGHARGAIRELHRAAARSWPALESEPLGGWLLRASAGWSLRANSVLVLDSPGVPVDQALDFVAGWYARRGLRPAFCLPMPIGVELNEELTARGWPPARPEILMLQADASAMAAPSPGGPPVVLDTTPSRAWLACYRSSIQPVPAAGVAVLTGNPSAIFARIEVDGEVLAIGRATVDDGWLGISAVETAPAARRRGLARQIICALVEHGRALRAGRAHLQVGRDNAAATALYRGLGMTPHHSYRYRVAAEGPSR